jgi:hypothetical protein
VAFLVELEVLEGIKDVAASIGGYGRLAGKREEVAGVHWKMGLMGLMGLMGTNGN